MARGRLRLHDVRITAKLAMILTLPILAVLTLAGYAVSITGGQAVRAQQVRTLTILAGEAGGLAYALELERAVAAQALAPGRPATLLAEYVQRTRVTDEAATAYRAARIKVDAPPANVGQILDRVDGQLVRIDALRDQVQGAQLAMSVALLRYRILVADLLGYRQAIAQAGASSSVSDQIRAAAALSLAAEFVGQEQTAVLRALTTGRLTPAALQEIVSTQTGYADSLLTFETLARPQWKDWFDRTVTGDPLITAQQMQGVVTRTATDGEPLALEAAAWVVATTARIERIRDVVRRVDAEVLTAVTAERDGQVQLTVAGSTGVLLVLLFVILLALWVARSMARSLTRLREGALVVSRERLPQAVERLRDERSLGTLTPEQVAAQSGDPVRVYGSDEIGQVAAAFNVVHREAVRIAAEQAQLRTSVAALFVSLGRRLQGMVDLLTSRLDSFEADEQDPARLEQLFEVDHLVTRMTRYTETLLALSGTPFARTHPAAVDLFEVLRGAVGKVERYTQIELGVVDSGVAVAPYAVDHVVHAIAELLDNATGYSPPTTPVIVEARRLSDRVVVQIVDAGVGMTAPQLARYNARLADPPPIDPEALRASGLVVVAHLAAWHGIEVTLSGRPGGGTVAEVVLPSGVLALSARHRRRDASAPIGRLPMVPRVLDRPDQLFGPSVVPPAVLPRLPGQRTGQPAAMPPVTVPTVLDSWRASPADAGWRAAAAAAAPQDAGTTNNGLPKRRPMAQLVPGSVEAGPFDGHQRAAIRRDPSAVAAAVSFYRRGLETARGYVGQTTEDSP